MKHFVIVAILVIASTFALHASLNSHRLLADTLVRIFLNGFWQAR